MVTLVLYACVGRNWHFMQLNDGNGLHQNKKVPLRKWSNFCLNGSFSFEYTHTQTERYHMPSEAIKPQYCQLGIVFVRAPCVCGGYLTRLAVWFGWLAWTQWSLCHTCVNSADKNCWTQEMANQNYQPHLFALLVWYTTWMSVVLGGAQKYLGLMNVNGRTEIWASDKNCIFGYFLSFSDFNMSNRCLCHFIRFALCWYRNNSQC